jgi:hypothetical protein
VVGRVGGVATLLVASLSGQQSLATQLPLTSPFAHMPPPPADAVREKAATAEERAVHPHMFVGPNPDEGAEGDNTKKRHAHGMGKPLTGGFLRGSGGRRVVCGRCHRRAAGQNSTQRHLDTKD